MKRIIWLLLLPAGLLGGPLAYANVDGKPVDAPAIWLANVKALSPDIYAVMSDMSKSFASRCGRSMTISNFEALATDSPGLPVALALLSYNHASDASKLPVEYQAKYQESIQLTCDFFDTPPDSVAVFP